ncbi:MAG TPA: cation diffusion facilitator family transporter, partial [Chitinophagaceae bacterium]|nr:cation diffusion facilitator family transporter [Chitinophagaceae bacterium]
LTVPYYINVNEAHDILDSLTAMFTRKFDNRVEFFIHVDGCLKQQCRICAIAPCSQRMQAFEHHIPWTHENILSNQKHGVAIMPELK